MTADMYFDYPLEQGLRRYVQTNESSQNKYFDYPLEQGLRLKRRFSVKKAVRVYFDYPLEQGLRHFSGRR